ncbi:MAG TPA: sigma 54-interacting transcriptional regulator [Blastocatellia bacterium]|nr:sigma 54-interacting transcriptional regulator [Blastocatellia bacterium]
MIVATLKAMDAGSVQSKLNIRLQQYQALAQAAESIAAHRDLKSLLKVLKERLQVAVQFDAVQIFLYDPEHNVMRRHVLESVNLPSGHALPDLVIEESLAGSVWQSQQPLLMTDLGSYESRYPRIIAELRQYGVKTAYILPLTSQGRRLGALGFYSPRESAWGADDQEFIENVAKLVAVAVDDTINFESARAASVELKHNLEHMRLMLKITTAVVSELDLRELLTVISSSIREVIEVDIVTVALFDQESGQLRTIATDAGPGSPARSEGFLVPLEGTPAGLAFTSGQPVLFDKLDLNRFTSDVSRRVYEIGYRAGGSIPLIAKGRKLGILAFASKRENGFSDRDKDLLCQVANQIAIAVDNALNFERARKAEQLARQQSERLELLLEINNAVVSNLDVQSLMKTISYCLAKVSNYDTVGLALYDPESNQLRAYSNPTDQAFIDEGQPIPFEGSAPGLAFTTGKPVLLDRYEGEPLDSEFTLRFRRAGFKSGGAVPLIVHGRKLGILGFATLREVKFSDEEVEMLCQIANQVAIAVENVLAFREIEALKNKLASEKLYLEDEIRTERNFDEIIGSSAALKRILRQVETVAPTDSTVLILGETGTGKELIARAIHSLSERRERTMVKLNCAAIPTGLLESELFGHEKGAFTGAISQRIGRFELAHKGTLFLDEVGDIPLELQPKLLRVLQEQEFERLGSTRTQRVDVRLVAATNSDIEQMVAEKKYRGDLYYRLNVFPITIPPLRERVEDIPTLARFFTQKYARRLKKRIESIPAEAMAALTAYRWPGNVRELEHFIERAVIITQGPDLDVSLSELKPSAPVAPASVAPASLSTLEAAEREHILRALNEANWVVGGPKGAAARLGMKRTTLQSRMQKLGLDRAGS